MLTSLSLIFLVGLSMAFICRKIKLPRIIGMLITGSLVSFGPQRRPRSIAPAVGAENSALHCFLNAPTASQRDNNYICIFIKAFRLGSLVF